jgi:hypothetical protein
VTDERVDERKGALGGNAGLGDILEHLSISNSTRGSGLVNRRGVWGMKSSTVSVGDALDDGVLMILRSGSGFPTTSLVVAGSRGCAAVGRGDPTPFKTGINSSLWGPVDGAEVLAPDVEGVCLVDEAPLAKSKYVATSWKTSGETHHAIDESGPVITTE